MESPDISFIDSHLHLTDPPYSLDPDFELEQMRQDNVRHIVAPAYDYQSWNALSKLKARYPGISIAIGLHPGFLPDEMPDLESFLSGVQASAIGEIGLDFRQSSTNKSTQIDFLKRQLVVAERRNLPVIIHCVHAYQEILQIISAFPNLTYILHRAGLSFEMAEKFLRFHSFFGIGPDFLNPRSRIVRELAIRLPADRILLETDSPYTKMPDGELARPKNLHDILIGLADARATEIAELASRIFTTSHQAFRIF